MNPYSFAATSNVAVLAFILIGIWLSGSLWPLVGLFFIQTMGSDDDKKED